jgi:hypothetical protein
MRELRVMYIDSPGFTRDVLARLIEGLPGVRLVPAGPDAVIVDDRHFATALPLMRSGVPTIVVGADDHPGFPERARNHGAMHWMPKESAHGALPPLLDQLVASHGRPAILPGTATI